MRKEKRIKAFFVFLAWLVIFAHSIIPHNHLPEKPDSCNCHFHTTNLTKQISSSVTIFDNPANVEERICHFSNFLFHQLGNDNLFVVAINSPNITPVISAGLASGITSLIFIFEPYCGKSLLRAPPLC